MTERDRPIVNPGHLLWTGQHWINYIRPPGAEKDSGMVSLWHTHYCEAGEGTVAFVQIEDEATCRGIFTDNEAIATYIQIWMRGRGGLYDMALPVVKAVLKTPRSKLRGSRLREVPQTISKVWNRVFDAELFGSPRAYPRSKLRGMRLHEVPQTMRFAVLFRRTGDVRASPVWIIESADDEIMAAWEDITPPVIMDAPAPKFHKEQDVYSQLFFADTAHMLLNGHLIPGAPYTTDKWRPSIGGARSSCVFALSETFIRIAPRSG